jgi:uncharacterized membrane protein YjjB (DUF3815 family)
VVVTLAGISPLLPGLTAYRGFYELSVEGLTDGLVTVTLALAIGLALAAGVTLGQYLTRPQATPLSRQIRHRRARGTNVPVDLRLAPARR